MMSSSNPFLGLFNTKENKQVNSINSILEQIFAFTLDESKVDSNEYLLLDTSNATSRELDLNNLQYALFDRLFNTNEGNPLLARCKSKGFSSNHCCEDKVIIYLYACYKNLKECRALKIEEEKEVKGHIIQNLVTAFIQPEVYDGQNLEEQLICILKEDLAYCENFFLDICDGIQREEEPGGTCLKDVIQNMVNLLQKEVIRTPLSTFDFTVFNILRIFTLNESIANFFMDCVQPSQANKAGVNYSVTLLGAIFNLSILPKVPSASFEHFREPLSHASNLSTEGMLWTKSEKVADHIHQFILQLLKAGPTVKERTLKWLGECLKDNAGRAKLWHSQAPPELNPANYTNVSDGFMINFGNVMLRLSQPFSANYKTKKILKVDPTYCAVDPDEVEAKGVHLTNMFEETCLLPTVQTEDVKETRLTADHYSFVTECFFLTHQALNLGFVVAVDKFFRMNQDMRRIERLYNEAVQSGGNSDVADTLKDRMTSEMSSYLSYKAQLSEPSSMKLMCNFISSTAYWLCQVAVHADFPDKTTYAPIDEIQIQFPVPDKVPDTLKCIPEFILETIERFLELLRRTSPRIFEEQGYEKLHPILTCILIYMGSSGRVKNPHLRARLAEGLECLLPHQKDEANVLKHHLGNYQRSLLFIQHEHRFQVVKSLLEVFVGIELTGESVEFNQKFNYRRPMYAIMEYLWERDEYHQYFLALAEEAERNMEAVNPPLFLRFANLLMNDAVYLLDESLANMTKIREMQTARENGEWDNLPARERSENMMQFHFIGMNARFDNLLGTDTIHTLEMLTSKVNMVFTHSTMVDRIAAMLNYFLLNLVGPNKKNFKVKDQKEYSFDPANMVLIICKIYINLKDSDAFCLAVSQDGRSYSPQLFSLAEDVLVRIGGSLLVEELRELAAKVARKVEEYQASEDAIAEAPDHFLDPIMSSLMMDPVILPSSKITVDRTTIARHLLSDQTDPFNRAPLSMDQVVPNTALAEEIRAWLEQRRKKVASD